MEKEENLNQENTTSETSNEKIETEKELDDKQEKNKEVEEKIDIKSLFIISKCSSVFFKDSEFLSDSSLDKICLDLSRLSIRFNASFANAKPPYS